MTKVLRNGSKGKATGTIEKGALLTRRAKRKDGAGAAITFPRDNGLAKANAGEGIATISTSPELFGAVPVPLSLFLILAPLQSKGRWSFRPSGPLSSRFTDRTLGGLCPLGRRAIICQRRTLEWRYRVICFLLVLLHELCLMIRKQSLPWADGRGQAVVRDLWLRAAPYVPPVSSGLTPGSGFRWVVFPRFLVAGTHLGYVRVRKTSERVNAEYR